MTLKAKRLQSQCVVPNNSKAQRRAVPPALTTTADKGEQLSVRCGGCGRTMVVSLQAIAHLRTIDCAECSKRQKALGRSPSHQPDAGTPRD